jgi:hypothetical protein
MRHEAERLGAEALACIRIGLAEDAYWYAVGAFRCAACCIETARRSL